MSDRQQRLARARLYLVCDERSDEFLEQVLAGGVDLIQLRIKANGEDERIIAAARRFARVCQRHDALLILNDRPDLAAATGLDGVHIGQADGSIDEARALVGPHRLVGLSTHSPAQIEAANAAGVDYIGVGPVHATPTKPGRRAVGLDLVRFAAGHAEVPFFAIGGISPDTVAPVVRAGGRRVAVVRALTEAAEPQRAARALRAALDAPAVAREAGVVKPAPQRAGWPAEPPMTRSQRRDAAIRAGITPIEPGERPRVIVIAAAVAAILALANLIAYSAGVKIGGKHPAAGGIVIFSAVMATCAVGMWRLWYGAVLGFMALLAIIATIFALLLIEASNVLGLVVALAVITGAGYLFFKLVRVLSRIQMPPHPGP